MQIWFPTKKSLVKGQSISTMLSTCFAYSLTHEFNLWYSIRFPEYTRGEPGVTPEYYWECPPPPNKIISKPKNIPSGTLEIAGTGWSMLNKVMETCKLSSIIEYKNSAQPL